MPGDAKVTAVLIFVELTCSKQWARVGFWRRCPFGRRRRPSKSDSPARRKCQFRAKLKRVTACDSSGPFVCPFLLTLPAPALCACFSFSPPELGLPQDERPESTSWLRLVLLFVLCLGPKCPPSLRPSTALKLSQSQSWSRKSRCRRHSTRPQPSLQRAWPTLKF